MAEGQQGNPYRAKKLAKRVKQDHGYGEDVPAHDMGNVVQIGRTNARGETILTPAELAVARKFNLEGFETIPDSGPVDKPAADADNDGDPALQELIDRMHLPGGNAGDDDHNDEGPAVPAREEKDAMEDTPDIPDVTELRSLFAATERKKAERLAQMRVEQERQERMQASAPETLAFLDETVFPELNKALSEKDEATIRGLTQIIERARKNVEVTKVLDERKAEREREVAKAAAANRRDQMAELYAALPDDPDAEPYPDGRARKLNSPTAALAATQKKGDSAMLVVAIPEGTVVPTGKGGYTTTEKRGAVQLRITVGKVEGSGGDRKVFRQAAVTKETDGLRFREVRAHPDAKPGVFNVIPHFFTRKDDDDRRNDPFDAIKWGIFLVHNREFRARKQDESFESALSDTDLTVTQLLLEGAVGSAKAEANWIVRVQGRGNERREYPRYLRVVLRRDEDDGPVHVAAWGPPAENRFSPRLSSLQPRKEGVVPLTVEAKLEEKERGVTAFVRFSTMEKTLMDGEDDKAKNVRAALRDLGGCSRQALLDEHTANASAEVHEDDKPHRHYWRKDSTCSCGERKASEA